MRKELAKRFESLVNAAKSIVIITHVDPDGDAIGSSLALFHFLKSIGKEVSALVPNGYPDFLAWMPGAETMLIHQKDERLCEEKLKEADLILCADFNSPDRMDRLQDAFNSSKATKILIDHHIDRGKFCDLEYHTTAISSTSELVYELLSSFATLPQICPEAAECLFVGIMTDTGSFSYACNYASTFSTIAALMECGIDAEKIHHLVYDTYSEQRLRLLGFCLSDKLQVFESLHTAFIALSKEDLKRFQYKTGDTEGVVNYTLGIQGIVFGALITERSGKIKISLRSKGDFDVNKIARTHFNGGGHKNASGGDLYCSFEEAVALFKGIIPQYEEELKKAAK